MPRIYFDTEFEGLFENAVLISIGLGIYDKWKRRLKNYNRKLYIKYKLRDHHALDDAIITQIIFEGKYNE